MGGTGLGRVCAEVRMCRPRLRHGMEDLEGEVEEAEEEEGEK